MLYYIISFYLVTYLQLTLCHLLVVMVDTDLMLMLGEKTPGVFALDGCTGAIDLSGNKNIGEAVNVDPKFHGPEGKYAKATHFGGQSEDSYIHINNTGSLDTLHSLSILVHVYPEAEGGTLLMYSDGGCSLTLEGKVLTFTAVSRVGGKSEKVTFGLGAMNKWYYVAAVFNSNVGNISLYVDEKLEGHKEMKDIFQLNTAGSMWVGTDPERKKYFSGRLSCIQVFDHPLTIKQIKEGIVCPTGVGINLPGKKPLSCYDGNKFWELFYFQIYFFAGFLLIGVQFSVYICHA